MERKASCYKYLSFLLMFYMTLKLTTVVLIYKIIYIGPFLATASTLIMPFWFVVGDLITEVYGYRVARHAIWMAVICQFVFAGFCLFALNMASPVGWEGQEAYQQVLGKLHLVTMGSFLAIISGAFLNAYALSKWKILLRGKYFWLRSLGSCIVGEFIFTVVAYAVEFVGHTEIKIVLGLMTVSFFTKMVFTPLLIIPSMYVAAYLKRSEGVDAYDTDVKYNPFSFGDKTTIEPDRKPGYQE